MKKKRCVLCFAVNGKTKILFRKMKLLAIFMFSVLAVSASMNSLSQTKFNLLMTNSTVKQVFREIEEKSDFMVIYNEKNVDVNRKVSVRAKDQPVESVLDQVFKGTKNGYKIYDRQIVILEADDEGVETASNRLFENAEMENQKSVTGKVTDNNKLPLPGVSIVIKGTNKGTTTDINGDYSIPVAPNEVLIFSFVGMNKQEIPINGRMIINVSLVPVSVDVSDVVVTALGLKREKKALGFSISEVKNEMMNRVPQKDILGALTAKMSGVKITNTSNDVNGDIYVHIRGLTSLAGNNNPLIVVDGVPVGDQRVMKDISPDNIENVSVLKGPSAAALYGSRAGNGVIIITSKSGSAKNKDIGVEISIGTTFSKPYKFINLQHRFTTGVSGVLNENSYQQWNGPEEGTMAVQWNTNGEAKPLKFYTNSLRDYFETGIETVYDASVNGKYDKGSYRLGINHLKADGVYPGLNLNRNSVNLSTDYFITKKVKVSTNIDISNPYSNNYPMKNGGETQYMAIYQVPPHINVNDLKDYWITPGVLQRNFNKNHDNPWFAAYELRDGFNRMRIFGNMKLEYQITPDLKLMGRYALSSNNEKRTYRQPWSSYGGDGGGNNRPQGTYNETINNSREINADFLLSYSKKFGKLYIAPSVGGNIMKQRNYSLYAGGDPLVLPNLYTLSNVDRGGLSYSDRSYNKNINSIYGLLNISYNDMIYFESTARNDWSSTLPVNNRSYFYPSASLSVLLNEMFTLPKSISLLKIRSGISEVGKDTDPYAIAETLIRDTWGANTQYGVQGYLPNVNLKPEIAKSFESGLDISLFDNRLGAEFTYYKVSNINQILAAPVAPMSGYYSAVINAGNVQNKGIEIGLNANPVKTNNLNWELHLNFTKERSKLVELTEGVKQYQFWESMSAVALTKVGEYVGDIVTYDVVRVTDKNSPYFNWPILDSNGKIQKDVSRYIKSGNFLHDFMVGFQTSVSYKNFTLSASIDWRQGGEYYDQTMMRLARAGKIEYYHDDAYSSTFSGILNNNSFNGDMHALASEIKSHPEIYQNNVWIGGRSQDLGGFMYSSGVYEGAYIPGVISDGKGGYIENFGEAGTRFIKAYDVFQPSGGYWHAGNNRWIYDASFIKLRELALSYTLPVSLSRKLYTQGITVSCFMRNLLLYAGNKTNVDPESVFNQVSSSNVDIREGQSLWNTSPIIMPLGFKVNVTF